MKYVFLILFLIIPNIYAKEDAISCTYKYDNDVITLPYYTESNKVKIASFKVNDKAYDRYVNKITSSELANCPVINKIKYYGSEVIYYYITETQEQFDELIQNGNVIYDEMGEVIGQVESRSGITSDKKTNYTHYASGEITGEVTNQTREQMDENIKAYASGACTHIEKTAIAQYFYEYDFGAIKTFRGSGIFKYNNEDIELSNDCAKEAEDLYNSLIILRETLSDYADTGGDVNTINFLSLQSSYFAGYGSLTTQWYDNKTTDDVCSAISEDIRNILNEFFNTFRLVCVILTIFMVYLDGMKCLAKKDDSETKKWITKSGKRLVMLVGALMLPLLVDFILNFIDKTMEGSYVRVNGECVKAITGGTK